MGYIGSNLGIVPQISLTGAAVGSTSNNTRIQAFLAMLSLTGMVLILLSTSKFGVGISPDSVNYVHCARSLLSGNGCLVYYGEPFTYWPPMFPVLLAALSVVGIDELDGARHINTLAFGLIILTSGQLFLSLVKSKILALLGATSILLSFPLVSVSVMAWSEPLFILASILFLIYLPKYFGRRDASLLVTISIIAALASIQRYAGLILVLTGLMMIVFVPGVALRQRIKQATVFGVLSIIPVALWLTRNYMLTSTLTGPRSPSNITVYQGMGFAHEIVTSWFTFYEIPFSAYLIYAGFAMLIAIAGLSYHRVKFGIWSYYKLAQVWSLIVFIVIYILVIVISSANASINLRTDRMLAPVYVFIIGLILLGLEGVSKQLACLIKRGSLGAFAVIGLFIGLMIYPCALTAKSVKDYVRNGAGGYATVEWQRSPTLQWVREHKMTGKIYSNAPDALYILTGTTGNTTLSRTDDIKEFRQTTSPDKNYLVWFNDVDRSNLYNAQEIASMFETKKVAAFADGKVYLFK